MVANNHDGLLQQVNEKRVTINKDNVLVKEILEEIQRQTGFDFVVNANIITELGKRSLKVNNVTVNQALNQLLQNSRYEYEVIGTRITFVLKNVSKQEERKKVGMITVKGKVADAESKEPIPGATILIAGTTKGAATDNNGIFTILVNEGDELEFSFIGMKTEKRKIAKNTTELTIYLQPDITEIEEVVVTGIVDRKAESFTGSALTIKGEELKRVGNQNIFQSLKNLDPTIYVMDNLEMGSDPNTLPDMMMRGRTGVEQTATVSNLKGNYDNKPNQPLFILDGFEASAERIFDLDMNTVESLTILKDASAKALYGSKAANGVVVIETKKLNSTKPRVTYTGSLDLNMPDLSSYDLCNALEKLELEYNSGVFDDTNYDDIERYSQLRKEIAEGLDTYWLSKPVRFGYGHKHSLNVELGKDELRTSLNFAYNETKGVMKGSDRKNISGQINVAYNLKSKFRFQNNFSLNSNRASDSPYGTFSQYAKLNPYENPYEKDGTLKKKLSDGTFNPLNDGESKTKLLSNYISFTNNFNMEWMVLDGLRIRGRFGLTHKTNEADRYYPTTHSKFADVEDITKRGSYEVNNGKETVLSGDINLNYAHSFNEKHNIFFNAGYTISETKSREVIHYMTGFPSDKMEDIMFALGYTEMSKPQGQTRTTRDLGILGMFSYTYSDRYLFDATYRANAASMFGKDNRWGSFWSLGFGWNVHKEAFAQELSWLKSFKIRGSLGLTGNQNFRNNNSIAIYQYNLNHFYNNLVGSELKNMENPNLKWEKKMDYNLGLDAEVFGLSVRLDWYNSLSENRVSSMQISPSTGFSSVFTNLGSVRNTGVELYLAYTLWNSKDGYFRVNGSVVHNKNKLETLSEDMKGLDSDYVEGEDMSAIKAVYSYGIDPATGLEMFRKLDGRRTLVWDSDDKIVVGVEDPKYRGVFGFSGEYKGFGLSMSCRFLGGGQMINQTLIDKVDAAPIKYNVDRRVLSESWMVAGDHVHFVRRIPGTPYHTSSSEYIPVGGGAAPSSTPATSRFVQDRKELDISSISVYYDVNQGWIKRVGMERMRFTVYMNDVYKWSSMGVERGTDYPFARALSFQLSLTF